MAKKKLKWGQTPFDRMTNEDLLLNAKRMYDACLSAYTALRLSAHDSTTGFWGLDGTGGLSIQKLKEVVDPLQHEYGGEQIYRAFYRFTPDLLWKHEALRANWRICPVCGKMISSRSKKPITKNICSGVFGYIAMTDCPGILRPIEWTDLILPDK